MFGSNKNPTVRVYIKQDPKDTIVKRKLQYSSDGQKAFVIIDPPMKSRAGWTLDVTGCVRNSVRGFYVEAIRGQQRALRLNIPENRFEDHAWTTDEIKQFAEMNVFKARYGKLLGDLINAIKPYLLILAVLVAISLAIGGYNAYTASQLPQKVYDLIPKVTPFPTPPLIQ
jgi:hypothetical protein